MAMLVRDPTTGAYRPGRIVGRDIYWLPDEPKQKQSPQQSRGPIVIDGGMSRESVRELACDLRGSSDRRLTVIVDSNGGNLSAGLDMADMLRADGRHTTAIGLTVGSAAVLPFLACQHRVMRAGATLSIHRPQSNWSFVTDKVLTECRADLLNAYSRYVPSVSRQTFAQWIDSSRSFTASEAVRAGLAHAIEG